MKKEKAVKKVVLIANSCCTSGSWLYPTTTRTT